MKVIQSYSSPECNTFDVIVDDVVIAYYYEHFVHPETNEKLNTSVFEIYFDYDAGEYDSSMVTEDYDEILDIIDSL